MIKMHPVFFEIKFSDNDFDCHNGFKPYRDYNNRYVNYRIVRITPLQWARGYCLDISVIDRICTGKEIIDIRQDSFWIYDYPSSPEHYYVPTHDEAMLIQALGTGELRGRTAETIVHSLWISALLHSSKLQEYFPEVYEFYKKNP